MTELVNEFKKIIGEKLSDTNTDKIIEQIDKMNKSSDSFMTVYALSGLFYDGNIFEKKIEEPQFDNACKIFAKITETNFKFYNTQLTNFAKRNPDFYAYLGKKVDISKMESEVLSSYSCSEDLIYSININLDLLLLFVEKNNNYAKLDDPNKLKENLDRFLSFLNLYRLPNDKSIFTEPIKLFELYKLLGGKGDVKMLSLPEIEESLLTLAIKNYHPLDIIQTIAAVTNDKSFKNRFGETALKQYLESLNTYKVNEKSILLEPEKVYEVYKELGGTGKKNGIIDETNKTIIMYAIDANVPVDALKEIVKKYHDIVSYKDEHKNISIDYFKKNDYYESDQTKIYDIFPRISIDQRNYVPSEYDDMKEIKEIEIIAGTISFNVYRNAEQDQIIYCFGDYHDKTTNLDCGSSLLDKKIYYMPKILKQIFKTSPETIIDYFQERDSYFRLDTKKREGKGSHGHHEEAPSNSGSFANIATEFKECFFKSIENDKKCYENYKNVRFHFTNTRHEYKAFVHKNIIDKETDISRRNYLIFLYMICSRDLLETPKDYEAIMRLAKNENTFKTDEFCSIIFSIPNVKKQLDSSYYKDEIVKFITKKCEEYINKIREEANYKNPSNFSALGTFFMDAYLLARVFKDYKKKDYPGEKYQEKAKKIIIHTGNFHIDTYIEFFKEMKFTEIYSKPSPSEYTIQEICTNISDMPEEKKKHLFDMEMKGGSNRFYKTYVKNKTSYMSLVNK